MIAAIASKYSQFAVLPARGLVHDLGLNYSEDRFYHRGHTWVKPAEDGTFTIGLDELADHLIGNPDSIKMPEVGSELEINQTAWRMKKNGNEIQVRAPLEGTVVGVGGPKEGWYLKIRPRLDPHDPVTLRHLLRGPEVHGWLSRELERLQLQLRAPNTPPTLGRRRSAHAWTDGRRARGRLGRRARGHVSRSLMLDF